MRERCTVGEGDDEKTKQFWERKGTEVPLVGGNRMEWSFVFLFFLCEASVFSW